jgi:plastocyanin
VVAKGIILLLVVLSVIVSGCLSSEENEKEESSSGGSGEYRSSQERWTPKIETSEEVETQGETETSEETWASEEIETAENTEISETKETETSARIDTVEQQETPEETENSGIQEGFEEKQNEFGVENERGNGSVQSGENIPKLHPVRLKNNLFIPSRLEINAGDIVMWRNYQESSVFTLTSKERLFEDQKLVHGKTLEYAFNEPGSYSFDVKGYPQMEMTITVK